MQKTAIPTFCEVKRPDYFSGFTVYTLCGGEKCLSILNLFFFFCPPKQNGKKRYFKGRCDRCHVDPNAVKRATGLIKGSLV